MRTVVKVTKREDIAAEIIKELLDGSIEALLKEVDRQHPAATERLLDAVRDFESERGR